RGAGGAAASSTSGSAAGSSGSGGRLSGMGREEVEGRDVRTSYPGFGTPQPRHSAIQRPSQELLVIRQNHQTGERSLDFLGGGLIPYWCSTSGRKQRAPFRITGRHPVIYPREAEAARSFFRDVLAFPAVDAGGGWLIFAAPPSEVACHPAESNGKH